MIVREILRLKGSVLYSVPPDMLVVDAVAIMDDQDIGSVLVLNRGEMVGMLSFREVFRVFHATPPDRIRSVSVEESMERAPLVASPTWDVSDLRRQMLDRHARYIPVMEEGVLLGVISFHDVAKAVLEEQSLENRLLKSYIKNWPETGV